MATILVDPDLCTRCGICSVVCPALIIGQPDENALPSVQDANAARCIQCGHCEAFCPSQALILNVRPEEKEPEPAGAGVVDPEELGVYLKMRRSVRHYTKEPVPKETVLKVLNIARYAASGHNGQPVQWVVVHDPAKVREVARLTIECMREMVATGHPLAGMVAGLVAAWDAGRDVICRGAPHLLVAHIPEENPMAPVDAVIALTHVDVAAPAFGIGTCWAGFVMMAAASYEPLQLALGVPPGRKTACAMLFGHPQYRACGIPRRKPLEASWQ
jgi:nitroreductase/ferredoxin